MNDVLTTLQKLPEVAYLDPKAIGVHNTNAPVIAIRRGVVGFYPIFTPLRADDLNRREGVTKAQAAAMHAGSLFGWEVPAADPDRYDEDGKLQP